MNREEALDVALGQIERQFGKGSVMRMGDAAPQVAIGAISTGALSLDLALGIGGRAARPHRRDLRPGVLGQDDARLPRHRRGPEAAAASARSSTPSTRWTRRTRERIGVNIDELLVSQPDYGEQALEIADAADPLGRGRRRRDRLGRGADAAGRARGRRWATSTVGLQARLMCQALRKLAGNLNRTNTLCLFTNQIREKIGVMFGSPETPAGRPRAEVLLLAAPRHPPDRDAQGGHRGGRQPGPRQGRQEQGRAAVPPGRVRHRVRPGHLEGGLPPRPRARARDRAEVGLVLLLRRRAARPGPQERQGVPARAPRGRPGDPGEDPGGRSGRTRSSRRGSCRARTRGRRSRSSRSPRRSSAEAVSRWRAAAPARATSPAAAGRGTARAVELDGALVARPCRSRRPSRRELQRRASARPRARRARARAPPSDRRASASACGRRRRGATRATPRRERLDARGVERRAERGGARARRASRARRRRRSRGSRARSSPTADAATRAIADDARAARRRRGAARDAVAALEPERDRAARQSSRRAAQPHGRLAASRRGLRGGARSRTPLRTVETPSS